MKRNGLQNNLLKKRSQGEKKIRFSVRTVLSIILILELVTIGMLLFSIQYVVKGPSMLPTLNDGDNLYYTHFCTPSYGDLIVFQAGRYGLVVKRVIGKAGDHIIVNADGSVIRNSESLIEPYIEKDVQRNSAMTQVTVEKGKLFVLGDNRAVSIDSRDPRIGQIAAQSVYGTVKKVVHSFG